MAINYINKKIHEYIVLKATVMINRTQVVGSLYTIVIHQGSYRLEKNLNLEGFLEKYLKIKSALKSTVQLLTSLEKS